jgi:hypothetical protein
MQRYFNVVAILLAALAGALALPAVASAGCPGCEEYTLDIPEDDSGSDPAPAPAPAPTAPTAPVAPAAPTTTVPEATTPVAPVVVSVEEEKPRKPVDTDPDPVPGSAAVKPVDLGSVPALAASQAKPPAGEEGGGVLPLAIAMGAVALIAAAIGGRRRGADPEAGETRSG